MGINKKIGGKRVMSDLTDEEIIATRKLHGLDDDLFKIEKEAKTNKQEKELNDLENFAELLRPEQRYYTNIIKKLVENARSGGANRCNRMWGFCEWNGNFAYRR